MEETKWYGESGKLELEELNHHFSTLDLQAWPWFSYPAMAFSGFDHKRKINRKSCTQDHNFFVFTFNHMAQQQSDLFCRSDKAEHHVGDIAGFCELVDSVGALLDTVGGRRGTFERFLAAQHMLATAHASQPEHTSANVLGHPLHLMELCG